jgi:glutamate 5-kinase
MHKRIVIKLGTSVLTGGSRHLDQARMVEIVRQCAALYTQGVDVIVCTSGAVAAGRAHLNFPTLPPTITSKQLFAAVGQLQLMRVWERLFDIYGVRVGQLLLMRSDVEDRQRYLNARDAFTALLEQRIVPIVNENDAVATEAIRVGDNDNLAALVATLVSADLLILLTDQAGLFTADPRSNPNAQLIPEVRKIDGALRGLASGSVSGLGTGGMTTKLQAANTARRAGVDVVIAAGTEPDVILRVAGGAAVGTRFPALDTRLESRKAWILAGPKPAGRLIVDDGAANAICHKGRSLLPAGIRKVEGNFLRGDTVLILDAARSELARGIAGYTGADLRQIAGCRSDEIEARLGYTYGDVAVHRNDLILLTD